MESHLPPSGKPIELTSERLHHLICSNDVPLPQEIPFIEEILGVQRNGVARLETQLSLLPNNVDRDHLESGLQAAESKAKKYAAVLSILRRPGGLGTSAAAGAPSARLFAPLELVRALRELHPSSNGLHLLPDGGENAAATYRLRDPTRCYSHVAEVRRKHTI
ncbi:hypothetical protein C8F04DRAFT_1199239 [Mycena alexandri]|uniref:Uncharacterized protein n=1 Tax=Mycena alexandri TaxID=1745969 RepID=A0AAD6S1H1_9AGAR|nr:hypothetical protein C8F04DRAFT_1199239 [Mycena alexandri]